MTNDKIDLTKNDELVKPDKKSSRRFQFFSSAVQNVDTTRYKTGADHSVKNTNDPILKAILRYRKYRSITTINNKCKGKDAFYITEVYVMEIQTKFWNWIKNTSPTSVTMENADIFTDVGCNNFFNSHTESSNILPAFWNGGNNPHTNGGRIIEL